MRTLRRLLSPSLIFLVFLMLAFGAEAHVLPAGAGWRDRLSVLVPTFLAVGAWISGAWLTIRLLDCFLWEHVLRPPVPRLLLQLSSLVVSGLALLGIVGFVFERNVNTLIAASSATGVVVGLALRTIILDAFSGIVLSIDRPFLNGDIVQINLRGQPKLVGKVVEVNWRVTRLAQAEGNEVTVPNSEVGLATILNLSRPNATREFELTMSVDFAVGSERVLRILRAALSQAVDQGAVLAEPEAKALVSDVDGNGVHYKVVYWADCSKVSPGKSRHTVIKAAIDHLYSAGLSPAFPKLDGFTSPMPDRALDYRNLAHRVELISRVELFHGLQRSQIEIVARQMQSASFLKGETVVRQSEVGSSLFVLVEGTLDVLVAKGDAGTLKLTRMTPGMFFGEISLLTGEPRSATVVADSDAIVYEITKEHLSALLESSPEFAQTLCNTVAERRLRESARFREVAGAEREKEVRSLSTQLLIKMRTFFGRVIHSVSKPA